MKVKIKEYFGVLPHYLDVNKDYEIEHIGNTKDEVLFIYVNISDEDEDNYLCIRLNNCEHLNGGSWELVGRLLNEI